MATPAPALFCPGCGQAIRLAGPRCPACQTSIALPPAFARELKSAARAVLGAERLPEASAQVRNPWLTAGALVLDLSFLGSAIFLGLLLFIRRLELIPLMLLGVWAALQVLPVPWLRGTPGMWLMRLEFRDALSGRPPDLIQALLRAIGGGFHLLTFGITLLMPWGDPERRSWPERLAGLQLVERREPRPS